MSMGPYRGIVTDNNDPLRACRVKADVPDLFFDPYDGVCLESPWIEATTAACNGQGTTWIPPIGASIFVWVEDSSEEGEVWSLIYMPGAAARTKVTSDIPAVAQGIDDESAAAYKGGVKHPTTGLNIPRYLLPHPGTRVQDESGYTLIVEPEDFQAEILIPNSYNEGAYPHNKVIKTPGGIVLEIDDTPGGERLHIWHPSGSYWELNVNGVLVERTSKKFVETGSLSQVVKGGSKTYVGNDSLNMVRGSRVDKVVGRNMLLASQIGMQAKTRMHLHSDGDLLIRSRGTCFQEYVSGRRLDICGMDRIFRASKSETVFERSATTYGSDSIINFFALDVGTVPSRLAGSDGMCSTLNLGPTYGPSNVLSSLGRCHIKINNALAGVADSTAEGLVVKAEPNVAFTTTSAGVLAATPLTQWNVSNIPNTGMEAVLSDLTSFVVDVSVALATLSATLTANPGTPLGVVLAAAPSPSNPSALILANIAAKAISLTLAVAQVSGTEALRSQ